MCRKIDDALVANQAQLRLTVMMAQCNVHLKHLRAATRDGLSAQQHALAHALVAATVNHRAVISQLIRSVMPCLHQCTILTRAQLAIPVQMWACVSRCHRHFELLWRL